MFRLSLHEFSCLMFRETMEQNEQVIFKVYEEKERVWEKEIRQERSEREKEIRQC